MTSDSLGLDLVVEPTGWNDTGVCSCCGNRSQCAWGFVHLTSGKTLLVYYVHWTVDHVDTKGANIDLILGDWGDGTCPDDRVFASFHYEIHGKEYFLCPIDPTERYRIGASELASRFVLDNEIGTSPLTKPYPVYIEAILRKDRRFRRILPREPWKPLEWWFGFWEKWRRGDLR